ncbi:MAG: D-alanyl-D-alanine carboxypeptidase [Oscillospiraceae bacterium]|nr:D-alanyl-D-alanine carboxypeptidase [Oscillospiraceae bacterium]
MKIRRILSVFLLCVLLWGLFGIPRAYALDDPDIQAKAALLVDADSGLLLYGKDERSVQYPASITKVMVALLVLEAVDRGELRMDQPITATATALADLTADSSTADIKVGEVLTVEQLLYCMLVVSANETGNILAEAVDGSKEAFVEHMNRRAAELGCENTHFVNTSGLHNPSHYTSARDIYLFTREAMKHEAFLTICGSKSYTVPATNISPERELHSTNGLISNWRYLGYLYDGAFGIKTGTTEEAGKCLVAGARRGDRTLISVILGAGSSEDGKNMSFTETSRLFDWGFDSFAPLTVLRAEQLYGVSVTLSKETDTVMAHPEKDTQAILPKDLDPETDLIYTLDLPESVEAPISAGDVLGHITVSYNGHDYATVPLLAISDVSASGFLVGKNAVLSFFSLTYVKVGLILLVIAVALFLFWWHTVRPRRRYGRNRRRSGGGSYRGRGRRR